MRRLIWTCVSAVCLLAAASQAASAFTATLSPAGEITSVSLGSVTFSAGETTISCKLTQRGSVNVNIVITAGAQIGRISALTIRECNNGATVTVLGLPYAMTLSEFLGTLPDNSTGFRYTIQGASFNLSLFGGFVNCLYRGNQPILMATTDTGTNTYRTGLKTTIAMPLLLVGGFGCPHEGELEGTFSFTAQTITIR